MSMTTLRQKFTKAISASERNGLIRVKLGKIVPAGFIVDVPNQPGRVYVRVYRNVGVTLTTAVNRGAPLSVSSNDDENDYWVRRDPKSGDYEIVRRIEIVDSDQPVKAKTIPPHRHNIGSGMEDPVEDLRFLPGLVHKKTGNTVRVRKFTYRTATGYAIFSASDFDLTSYLPATDYYRAWVVVGFDPDTATITAVTGDEYSADTELTNAHIADISVDFVPLVAIKTQNGQSAVEYTDFVDLRQHFMTTSSVSSAAPIDARYWISEANGDLTNGVNLGALTSGLLKHTVSGGISTPATAASADVVGAIDDGAITGAKIAGGAIDASKLASNSVTTDKIVNTAVTTAKIANGNITTEKILDANVTEAKLATSAVTTNKINDGAVTSIKIGSSLSAKSIGSSSISNYLDFDEQGSNPSNPASTAIRAFSREFDGESELRLIDSNGIDQNVSDIIITVKNGTGSTIAKSRICKLTSLDGSDIQVFLAQANTFSGAQGILCFTLESIANGATGRALLRGVARTDLTGFAATSPGRVWLSTSSAGGITGTEPTTVAREVGVVRAGGTSGIFIFDPQSPNYAPYNADYWVSQSNSNLITEVNLGALANGIIQHSVSGGVSTPSSLAGSSAGDALRWSGSAWQAVGNAMTEITPFTQLNADTGSFTINSISGNYSHLLLQLQIKTDAATETDGVVFRLNGDTTAANYYNFSADISHSGVVSSAQALGTTGNFTIRRGGSGDAAAVANLFSIINIWIFNYTSANISSNRRIVVKWEGFTPSVTGGGLYVTTGGGHYLASAAVTSLTIAPNSGSNLKQNSSYALWGIG